MTGDGGNSVEDLHLDPDTVEDEELLSSAVDEFIRRDPDAAETLVEIARLHGVLHDLADAHWWPIWARAEELGTARWADLSLSLVQWAFNEGRRFPAVPPGGGA